MLGLMNLVLVNVNVMQELTRESGLIVVVVFVLNNVVVSKTTNNSTLVYLTTILLLFPVILGVLILMLN
jgi:hypothetical protein